TSLNRENLYRMLSSKGNPEFFSLSAVLRCIGFRLAVEPKATGGKLILYTHVGRAKQQLPNYRLAADSDSNEKTETLLLTPDDKEVGALEFDYKNGALILHVRSDISLKELKQAEILTKDGKTVVSEISIEGEDRIVLLRKMKLYPKDVSQITLALAE
ncbi:hypothetical protein L0222_05215, partial [bacterium]|nr:hypothetical protein [bacterium]